jgi:hypothetical protein
MSKFAKVVSSVLMVKANGKRTKMICWHNILKISRLFYELKASPGEQGISDGEFVLTVAFCPGQCAWKLTLNPDFGGR